MTLDACKHKNNHQEMGIKEKYWKIGLKLWRYPTQARTRQDETNPRRNANIVSTLFQNCE